jgi:two-component system chemotaxis response regulator CheB
MGKIELFVIGASAGGLEALKRLVSRLPPTFPGAVCIVVHMSADSPGHIPEILSSTGPLPAHHAKGGERLKPGCIYVAPPDHHLLVDRDQRLRLGHGPKENRFRPAIDPLFRSAALALDGRTAGIILSGGLDDGVAGLITIQRCGGATLVQEPSDAMAPSMPLAALRAIEPDRQLPADRIAGAMIEFAATFSSRMPQETHMTEHIDEEISVAAGADSHPFDALKLGDPTLLTCPDCHGALVQLRDTLPARFRCHTGHAYSIQSLSDAVREQVEQSLWNSIRCLEEYAMLLDHIGAHHVAAAQAKEEAEQARRRSQTIRAMIRSN